MLPLDPQRNPSKKTKKLILLLLVVLVFSATLFLITKITLLKNYIPTSTLKVPLKTLTEVKETAKCNGTDINYDGKVNAQDLGIVSTHYNANSCHFPEWCVGADINRNGTVNYQDLGILATYYDRTDCKPEKCYLKLTIEETARHCDYADINRDGKVDYVDLGILATNYDRTDCSAANNWCEGADTDVNTMVDYRDQGIVATNYNRQDCDDDINFSLLGVENLYGIYESSVIPYTPDVPQGKYTVKTYDNQLRLLNQFSVDCSRVIFDDTLDGGSITETDMGNIEAIIPYDASINRIKITNSVREVDLGVNPAVFICERTCKIENETGTFGTDVCCWGWIPVPSQANSFICVNCGDGYCSSYESPSSCYEDCQ